MTLSPFEVTKAVSFTDEEIAARFVNFAAAEYPLVDPRSPITQYLVGGKGGGRTHLMRFYAYPLQKARATGNIMETLKKEGYVGIYAPASGLDANRYAGARIDDDAWAAAFAQSLELRLVSLLFDVIVDIHDSERPWREEDLNALVLDVLEIFGDSPQAQSVNLNFLRGRFADFQRQIDRAVNNAPMTRTLDLEVRFSPGSLLFGSGQLVQRLRGMDSVKLTYMLDELENLSEHQQMFVNTLVREMQLPTCLLIGAREWGIRTFATLGAGEENREGSEYQKVVPENAYSQSGDSYRNFCIDMIERRLCEAGLSADYSRAWVTKLNAPRSSPLNDEILLAAIGDNEAKHLGKLRVAALQATHDGALAEAAVEAVRFPEHPLLEKLTILRAYQSWSKAKVFSLDHFLVARAFIEPIVTGEAGRKEMNFLNLWRQDMIAQILTDQGVDLRYSGIDTFISMSGYLPRSLLVALRMVTNRAGWVGERPFEGLDPIPVETQSAGIREASAWFLNDVRPLGDRGTYCDRAVRRVGSLLRDLRYSDKPSEVSLTTFSSNLEHVTPAALAVLDDCVKYRMLIEVPGGRQARNQGSVHRKFQLHPMLAPFFGLGFGRRGDLTLTGTELMALFSPEADESEYQALARKKTAPLRAPFAPPSVDQLF